MSGQMVCNRSRLGKVSMYYGVPMVCAVSILVFPGRLFYGCHLCIQVDSSEDLSLILINFSMVVSGKAALK